MVVHPAVGSPNGTFVNALLFHLGPEGRRLLDDSPIRHTSLPHVGSSQIEGEALYDYEEDDGLLDDDIIPDVELDLPETPEAANASPTALRPGIVHRLDKGTSGVLIAGLLYSTISYA